MDTANKPMIREISDEEKKEDKNYKEHIPFEDGGEVTLSCSNCDKPLVVVWRTRPNERIKNKPVEWRLKAKCCYCEDYSFTKKIIGGFHHKGYDTPHSNGNPEDVVPHVNIMDIQTNDDEIIFITKRAK